ncbi:hypothetical protein PIB30_081657 [Stylosanthes scabra]|uniref:Uncharacterized protein n=1 Tax=Stylosanthes scabra TaxID=79078 RepID=A0ABU6QRV7_9FABA|nr:hypothetical protein [Stylosanthes scabra]
MFHIHFPLCASSVHRLTISQLLGSDQETESPPSRQIELTRRATSVHPPDHPSGYSLAGGDNLLESIALPFHARGSSLRQGVLMASLPCCVSTATST